MILRWVNHANLFRIKGIASQFAELLEASEVDSVVELGTCKAETLHAKLVELNAEKKLVRQVPGLSQIKEFVSQAKSLDRVVEH